jgi:hypothetical protein
MALAHFAGGSSASTAAQARADNTASKNNQTKKRWFFFGHAHVMHTSCESEPASTTQKTAGCDVHKKP